MFFYTGSNCQYGGVLIYVKLVIQVHQLNGAKYLVEMQLSTVEIKFCENNFYVISVHRSPSGDFNSFIESFRVCTYILQYYLKCYFFVW